jgi:hypothetical protein
MVASKWFLSLLSLFRWFAIASADLLYLANEVWRMQIPLEEVVKESFHEIVQLGVYRIPDLNLCNRGERAPLKVPEDFQGV